MRQPSFTSPRRIVSTSASWHCVTVWRLGICQFFCACVIFTSSHVLQH